MFIILLRNLTEFRLNQTRSLGGVGQ